MNLRGKQIIVTGGASGLGRSMVEKLVALEAAVTVFDINVAGLDELRQLPELNCVECDVSNYDEVIKATAEYHHEFGAADVLINNAGILYSAPLVKITSSGI